MMEEDIQETVETLPIGGRREGARRRRTFTSRPPHHARAATAAAAVTKRVVGTFGSQTDAEVLDIMWQQFSAALERSERASRDARADRADLSTPPQRIRVDLTFLSRVKSCSL